MSTPRDRVPWILLIIGLVVIAVAPSSIGHKAVEQLRVLVEEIFPLLVPLVAVEVFKELGIALAIIATVALFMERQRIENFTDQISRIVKAKLDEIEQTTLNAIIRGPLPREYYEEISKVLLFNHFLRTDWAIRLTFSLEDTKEYIKVSFDQEYKIKNLYGYEKPYLVDHLEALEWEDKFPDATKIQYVRVKYERSTNWIVNEAAETGKPIGVKEHDFIRFKESVSVPTDEVLVVHEGSIKIIRERGYEGIIVGEPTLGMKCWITHQDDLIVNIEYPEIHPGFQAYKGKVGEERLEGGKLRSYWEFPSPMPPFSYYIVNWHKKTENPTS